MSNPRQSYISDLYMLRVPVKLPKILSNLISSFLSPRFVVLIDWGKLQSQKGNNQSKNQPKTTLF